MNTETQPQDNGVACLSTLSSLTDALDLINKIDVAGSKFAE